MQTWVKSVIQLNYREKVWSSIALAIGESQKANAFLTPDFTYFANNKAPFVPMVF
jgi:hypothetical protein